MADVIPISDKLREAREELLRRHLQAHSAGDIDAVVEELLDRYGPLPVEARRVVSVARLRLVAQKYRVREIVLAGSRLRGRSGRAQKVSTLR